MGQGRARPTARPRRAPHRLLKLKTMTGSNFRI